VLLYHWHPMNYDDSPTQTTRFNLLKQPMVLVAMLIIAVVAGTGGYLLGTRTRQGALSIQPRQSAQTPMVTQQLTPPPIPDGFVSWKTHTSSLGYSIKYPPDMDLVPRGGGIDFQLQGQDLHVGFVIAGLPENRDIQDYATYGWCLVDRNGIRKQELSGVVAYRSENVFDGTKCLDAMIALHRQRWVVDIQGKAKGQAGVALFNEILSTFRLTQ